MPYYVDGFVLAVPLKNARAYRTLATRAGKIWKEHGALSYCECAGDDLNVKWPSNFPRLTRLKRGETVYFSWIVYKSRKHRDQVNARVMKDPRIAKMMQGKQLFDMKRMTFGGFKTVVDL
jgi:uncharacterized protein YbaA (DUF1428 family)